MMVMKNYKLHLVEYPNEGPKIVLIHGLGGTHRYWNTGIELLKKNYHLILIDLLGFGDSEKPWINYTKSHHLKALETHLANLGPFYLIGHSLGAALSIAYCAKYPKQCLGQILISLPFFSNKQKAFRWLRQTPTGWLMTNMITAIITCIITRRVVGRFLPKLLKEFPVEIAEDLLKHSFLSSTTTLWQVLYHTTIPEDLRFISNITPTLCIHSLNDDTAPIETVKQLVKEQPGWELKTLVSSAHHPWLWDNPSCQKAIEQCISNWSNCEEKLDSN